VFASGCNVISIPEPILTRFNSDPITQHQTYYHFVINGEKFLDQFYYLEDGPTNNLDSSEHLYLINHNIELRIKRLKEHTYLSQLIFPENKEGKDRPIFLFILKRTGNKAKLFPHKNTKELLKNNPYLSQSPLVDHITSKKDQINFDQIAATKYQANIIDFFKSLTDKDLKLYAEIIPADRAKASKHFCTAAAAPSTTLKDFKDQTGVKWVDLNPEFAINQCNLAVKLNPNSENLKYYFGRALHKAGRFSEATKYYKAAREQASKNLKPEN